MDLLDRVALQPAQRVHGSMGQPTTNEAEPKTIHSSMIE
jgi:hypothetical protein